MTEFEDRLTSALRSAGDGAPDAAGLVPAARRRVGVRRRRTALVSVGAVVAVAGVVGGVALLGQPDGGGRLPVADDTTSTPTVSSTGGPQTRVESWRDLSVTVPAEWGHGMLDDWCGDGGSLASPTVERPGASIDILCEPVNGYGVRFFDGSLFDAAYPAGEAFQLGAKSVYPVDAWIGYQRDATGNNAVLVVTPDRETTQGLLDSFVRNTSVDANGCSPHGEPGPDLADGLVRLCRYDIDGWLEQSELLTGADADKAIGALEGAPAKDPDRMCTMELSGPSVQITSADAEGSLTLNACQGFTWDGVAHELTSDAIYWALSPGWSGGVEGDVPMPDKLRQ